MCEAKVINFTFTHTKSRFSEARYSVLSSIGVNIVSEKTTSNFQENQPVKIELSIAVPLSERCNGVVALEQLILHEA